MQDRLVGAIQFDCPICNKEHTVELWEHEAKSFIKGEFVTYLAQYLLCPDINNNINTFVTAKMMDDNLLRAKNVYRSRHG